MGTELVDWQLQQSSCVHSRVQAVGMWQVLLEEGVLNHGEAPRDVCLHVCSARPSDLKLNARCLRCVSVMQWTRS